MPQSQLFAPVQVGALPLKHRVIMAPLTRMRSDKNGVVPDIAIEYYAQRASGECEAAARSRTQPARSRAKCGRRAGVWLASGAACHSDATQRDAAM